MGPSGTGRWQEIFIRGEPGPLCSTKTSSNHSPLCPGTCVGLFGCSRPIYYTVCSKALFSQSMWDWKWILEQPQVKEHLSCTLSDSEEGKAGTAGTLHPDKIWHSNKPLQPQSFLWVTRSECHYRSKSVSKITPIISHSIPELCLAGRDRRNRQIDASGHLKTAQE